MYEQQYFNRKGEPITIEEWGMLHSDRDYSVIANTIGCGRRVSTVWLGLNHGRSGGGPPIIFETMVFRIVTDGETDFSEIDIDRYATEKEAREGHDRLCRQYVNVLDRIVKEVFETNEVMDDPD